MPHTQFGHDRPEHRDRRKKEREGKEGKGWEGAERSGGKWQLFGHELVKTLALCFNFNLIKTHTK